MERKRLGDAELDIMLAIWSSAAPMTSTALQLALKGKRDWTLPALLTSLNRLTEKGFLRCQKENRSNSYTALVSRQTYQMQEGQSILERIYGGSLTTLAASLYSGGAVSREELTALRRFLDEQEG